jgi:methyl-accepting chemotaxis protein
MVGQSTSASHSLSQETEQLMGLVGQFQVGGAAAEDPMRRELRKVAPHAFRQPAKAPVTAAIAPAADRRAPSRPTSGAAKARVANAAPVAAGDEDWQEF